MSINSRKSNTRIINVRPFVCHNAKPQYSWYQLNLTSDLIIIFLYDRNGLEKIYLHSIDLYDLYKLLKPNLPIEITVCLVQYLLESLLCLPGIVLGDHEHGRHDDGDEATTLQLLAARWYQTSILKQLQWYKDVVCRVKDVV